MTKTVLFRGLSVLCCVAVVGAASPAQRLLYTFTTLARGAGDVNGDGYPDFVVRASGTDLAHVVSGKDLTVLVRLQDKTDTYLVRGLASAGDVNRDGVPDVLVGDFCFEDCRGVVSVFSGKDGVLLHKFKGDAARVRFGSAFAGVGDVDGDGHADVLIGAPLQASTSTPGSARVYSGRDGKVIHDFKGNVLGAGLGVEVAGAGDVDRDGRPDLLLGSQVGVTVASGKTGGTIYSLAGRTSPQGTGDVNGDGYDDFMATITTDRVEVFSGKNGKSIRVLSGVKFSSFGTSSSGGADINLDGVPDIVVGAPDEDRATVSDVGSVTAFSGKDGKVLYKVFGMSSGERLGHGVSFVGDVDRDGHPDFLVDSLVFSGKPNDLAFSTFGSACPDAKPPVLRALNPPLLGMDMLVEVGNLKPAQMGLIVLGFSNTTWQSTSLPLDLSFMGMAGCQLLVSWDLALPVFSGSGTVRWKQPVPAEWGLLGLPFYAQAWVLDDKVNAAGISTSNGGKGVIQF